MRHSFIASVFVWSVFLAGGCAPREEAGVQDSSVAVAPAPAPTATGTFDPALRDKRIAYRDAMRELVAILKQRYMQGSDSIDQLLEAEVALSDAELAMASTQDERMAALEASLEKLKEIEQVQNERIAAGVGRSDELAKAKAARLYSEILLLEQGSVDK